MKANVKFPFIQKMFGMKRLNKHKFYLHKILHGGYFE